MNPINSTFTFTFGDCAENHKGMEMLGTRGAVGSGFTPADLLEIQGRFLKAGATCEYYDLSSRADLPAAVLVLKKGVQAALGIDTAAWFKEQAALDVDKKAFMRGAVKNKKARWNLCFDEEGHEPDYEKGKGRVVAYRDMPLTRQWVEAMPLWFGPKAVGLKGEANYYYDIAKCGIGYHGDSERRKVVAVRLGAPLPLYFQWYHRSAPVGARIEVPLEDGDVYVMSEKAVGTDWMSSSQLTLRHATGSKDYTTVKA